MSERVGSLRVMFTLIAVHVKRALRRIFMIVRTADRNVRAPTARKGTGGYLMVGFITVWMCLQFVILGDMFMDGAEKAYPGGGARLSGGAVRAVAAVISLLSLVILLAELRMRDLEEADADLERLGALPLETSQLMAYRLADRAAPRRIQSLALVIMLGVVAWREGWRWAAPALGLAAALPVLLAAAAVYTPFETLMRLKLTRIARQRLDALLSISVSLLSVAMTVPLTQAMQAARGRAWPWVAHVPDFALAWPPGLAVHCLTEPSPERRALLWLALCLEAALMAALALRLCSRMLSDGLMSGSGADPGVRGAIADGGPVRERRWLSPYQARLLTHSMRDGATRVQALFVLVVAGFLASVESARQWVAEPKYLAAVTVFAGLSVCPRFASAALAIEGKDIWLLFCAPWDLRRVLREAMAFGMSIALPGALAFLAIGAACGMPLTPAAAGYALAALAGVACLNGICVCAGAIDCDPYADLEQNRISRQGMQVYAMLFQAFCWTLALGTPWQIAVQLILLPVIWFAYWQQAVDYLPFVLDPVASPPPRVSLANGLAAVYAFAILQGIGIGAIRPEGLRDVTAVFVASGTIVFFLAKFSIWRSGLEGGPLYFSGATRPSLEQGLRMGLYATAAGVVWMNVMLAIPDVRAGLPLGGLEPLERPFVLILTVLAAPIIEEYLFRGLVFGGLRRSLEFWPAALGSAAVFALLHPPASFPAVFALGVAAALARERTGGLLGPVVAHALYNGIVMACQMAG